MRRRLLIRLASLSAAVIAAAAILRRGAARPADLRASIICTVREPVPHPLCGIYAAAFTRLLALFNLHAGAEVVACRGTGKPTCVLQIPMADGHRPEAA